MSRVFEGVALLPLLLHGWGAAFQYDVEASKIANVAPRFVVGLSIGGSGFGGGGAGAAPGQHRRSFLGGHLSSPARPGRPPGRPPCIQIGVHCRGWKPHHLNTAVAPLVLSTVHLRCGGSSGAVFHNLIRTDIML